MTQKYTFKTKPYRHQVQGIRFAFKQFRRNLGVAFLFEPRTGKTKTTVDCLSILYYKHNVRKVLIVAPSRVLGVWVQELTAHSPLSLQIVVWDAAARKKGIPPMQTAFDMQVLITNFEAFATPGRKTASGRRSKANGRFKHRTLIEKWLGDGPAAGVIDEGHKLKNPSGKASNMILSLAPMFKYRFLLTGTPITKAKRAADIFMQWRWVNPARFRDWGSTYQEFCNHTGKWIHNNGFPQWVKENSQGMRDLQQGIHQDGLVIHRTDCFDLPPRMPDRFIPITLSPQTKKHYDEMARDMYTKLISGEISEASIALVVTLRLSQITSGFCGVVEPHPTKPNKLISRPVRVGSEKLDALEELLVEETIEREEKIVICARFQADLNAIETLCKQLVIPRWSIRGGMTRSATDDALRAFRQHSDGPAVIVVQPQAGGVGIDMSTAHHMVWYGLIQSWVDFVQMSDRIALSPRGVQYTYLIAENSIDQLLYDTLQRDGDVSAAILRNPALILPR